MAGPAGLPAAALLALALLLRAASNRGAEVAKSDGDLLRDFKATFSNGDTALAAWPTTGEPCSGASWAGVRCVLYSYRVGSM